ncbi:hypothetical protein IQ247_10860 [Plectonema cf. radiosum LEGE 06105]|uniref:Uncharacterized protein n=1 Tax=Plectonema cf. radiosum LEGE 06105 TaxID=945769 RepID=A0A8J7K018_9CYAN|nr:hypothetical protein [Plectonema radiosum]MBE9213166.1 hypothetical protein [Plectonema cf. radiosum LEGE 06105]
MSRLEITDLSFCQTEFLDDNQVQGGLLTSSGNRFLNALFSRLQPWGQPLQKDGYEMQELYDPETDSSGMMMLMGTENSTIESGVVKGNFSNGGIYEASFAKASSGKPLE